MTWNSQIVNETESKNGWYTTGNQVISQSFYFVQSNQRYFKGMKWILNESGNNTSTLLMKCRQIECDSDSCCAARVLAWQPDVKSRRTANAETIGERGHYHELLPKYHCELNYIERYWGTAKRLVREQCDHSYESLCSRVLKVLDFIRIAQIRRFSARCWKYYEIYVNGKDGFEAVALMNQQSKAFKFHRRVTQRSDDGTRKYGPLTDAQKLPCRRSEKAQQMLDQECIDSVHMMSGQSEESGMKSKALRKRERSSRTFTTITEPQSINQALTHQPDVIESFEVQSPQPAVAAVNISPSRFEKSWQDVLYQQCTPMHLWK